MAIVFRRIVFSSLCFGLLAPLAVAQVQVPNEFQSGQPARAAEVNQNFQALVDAIDSNQAEIDANTAALAALPTSKVVILDLALAENCNIDTPGRYVLHRDWLLTPTGTSEPPYGCQINVRANATIDFRGFQIDVGDSWSGDDPAISVATGVAAVIKNGAIRSDDSAILGDAAFIAVREMRVHGKVEFDNGEIVGSWISGREDDAVRVRGNGVIRDSTISCTIPCIVSGPGNLHAFNNLIEGDLYPTVVAFGPDNIIRNNSISGSVLLDTGADNSIVAWNTIDGDIDVLGTTSVLDNNIAGGSVNFAVGGNFFGNNRIRGTFQGGAGQTDWGGNVTY